MAGFLSNLCPIYAVPGTHLPVICTATTLGWQSDFGRHVGNRIRIRALSWLPRERTAMTAMEKQITDYLEWMKVHNYARTTIENRRRYLGYFSTFTDAKGIDDPTLVTFECLLGYQQQLFDHRKYDGLPLSFGTQVQRLVPVTQLFSWLRREHRIAVNPAADLLMPRPDRKLPEATLSASEMSKVLAVPDVGTPLGLRDRAVLEVFYSCGLRRNELINLWAKDVDFERGTVFVRCGKGSKDRYVPIGERALFWLRLYLGTVRPQIRDGGIPASSVPLVRWDTDLRRLAVSQGSTLPVPSRYQQAR